MTTCLVFILNNYRSTKFKLPEEPRLPSLGDEKCLWVLPRVHWFLVVALVPHWIVLAIQWTIWKITDDPDVLLEEWFMDQCLSFDHLFLPSVFKKRSQMPCIFKGLSLSGILEMKQIIENQIVLALKWLKKNINVDYFYF